MTTPTPPTPPMDPASPALLAPTPPAPSAGPPPPAGPAGPPSPPSIRLETDRLDTADRLVILVGFVAGLLATAGGWSSIGATLGWLLLLGALRHRVHGRSTAVARRSLEIAMLLALVLSIRQSPWIISLTWIGIVGLTAVGVSTGVGAASWTSRPRHAFRIFELGVVSSFRWSPVAPEKRPDSSFDASAIGRGLAFTIPLVAVLMALLASGDSAFASLISLPSTGLDGARIVAAALVSWLALAAVVASRSTADDMKPTRRLLGSIEAQMITGGLLLVLGLWVVAQFTSAAVGVVDDAEVAKASARSGFFQLCWAAGIVLATVAGVQAFHLADGPARRRLSGGLALTSLLTIVMAGAAGWRLVTYVEGHGITMMRTAAAMVMLWIVAVMALLAVKTARGDDRTWLTAAAIVAALAIFTPFVVADPEARVTEINLDEGFHRYHLVQDLSTDATPSLVDGDLTPAELDVLVRRHCDDPSPSFWAWNLSDQRARDALGC